LFRRPLLKTVACGDPKQQGASPIGGYAVEDATGRTLAYVYGRDTTSVSDDRLTREEARRVAKVITRLPELLRG
jgi:hypothetical protein